MKKKQRTKECECCGCRVLISNFNDPKIPLCCMCDTPEEIQKWENRNNTSALKITYDSIESLKVFNKSLRENFPH